MDSQTLIKATWSEMCKNLENLKNDPEAQRKWAEELEWSSWNR